MKKCIAILLFAAVFASCEQNEVVLSGAATLIKSQRNGND